VLDRDVAGEAGLRAPVATIGEKAAIQTEKRGLGETWKIEIFQKIKH
jgi:hypothetical protein